MLAAGLVTLASMLAPPGLRAADVEVVKRGAVKSAISLDRLEAAAGSAAVVKEVLHADLERWGWFRVERGTGTALQVAGTCLETEARLTVDAEVVNRATGARYLAERWQGPRADARGLAHRVADAIVEAVTGAPGIASTQIAMIASTVGRKDVYLCDADGAGMRRITGDGAVCLALSWSPEGQALYYTSFHRGYPDVYRLELSEDMSRARRVTVAGYPGINAGAALAPDGRRLALVLSKDGNPDLYIKDLRAGTLQRVTRTQHAAEASPAWSPDGKRLVFVSDRSGRPQLYVRDAQGGRAERITFEGRENVAPDWGPGGDIAYSSRRGGVYAVCVADMETGRHRQLTPPDADYEDPSWAPDGRHLVCSRTSAYRSGLVILDVMGEPPVRLTGVEGDWCSPAWSPRPDR